MSDNLLENYRFKILDYGDWGAGKTCFAGTWPKPFLLDFDRGRLSLGLKFMKSGQFTDFPRDPSALAIMTQTVRERILPGIQNGTIETLVLDSLTTYADICKQQLLKVNKKEKMELQLWGELGAMLQSQLNILLSLPCHFILIAHEKSKESASGGVIKTQPLAVGQFSDQVGNMFDEVYWSHRRGDDYLLLTKTEGVHRAKSRLDGFLQQSGLAGIPARIAPDYEVLMAYLQTAIDAVAEEEAKEGAAVT